MPNGININRECGSTHLDGLQRYVKEYGCDVGFAFDGDADRMLAVDENGEVVDGDKIIAICAKDMKNRGVLTDDTAVVTVMSNMGFFEFCKKNGIKSEITKVGDRYVLENMRENNFKIGGEQSGHVIFFDFASTGDGQLTALQLLAVMKRTGKKLSEHGIKFLIHNHYHEFQKLNGKEILFHIMDNTDPNYVSFELDTFWAMRGGMDPLAVMDRLGDRLKLIHQKDFSKTSDSPINLWTVNDPNVLVTWDSFGKGSDHKDFCEIGTGIMDIQSIINKGNELGAEYIVLEQDHTQLTQMESVRISMDSFHKFSGLDW